MSALLHRRRSAPPLLIAAVVAALVLALVVEAMRSSSIGERELRGSGVPATQARHVPAFTGVSLDGVGVVSVRAGARRAVDVRGDDNVLPRVTTRVRGGVLVIALKGRVLVRRPLRIVVTTPTIQELRLSGGGTITATRVRAQRLRVTLSGTGSVRARGVADRVDAELDGSGELRLGNLRARVADVRLNGTGHIVVHATRELDATVAGVGEILYRGDPERVRSDVQGVGVIAKAPA